MTPGLDGRLVRLEPMEERHIAGLSQVAFDPVIWRYYMTSGETPEKLRAWVEAAIATPKAMPWVTVLRETGEAIGSTRFMEMDLQHGTVELGSTWIAPRFQGTAVNPEVKLLQMTHGFEVMGLRRIALKTHHDNLQSQAAMRKMGALCEGTFRNHYVMPDGSQRHSVWFSVIREEWPRVKAGLEERLERLLPSA